MTKLTHSAYGIGVQISGPFEDCLERVKTAFAEHGFGVLSEIDVSATLMAKIGEDIEPYTILGMCNPHLASRALKVEHEVGLLLPCNVLVHECGGTVHVSAQDPLLMMAATGNPGLQPIAEEAKLKIEQALTQVAMES